MSDKEEETPPLLVNRVLGFRQFNLAADGKKLRLQSCGVQHTWEPGVNTAICKPPLINELRSAAKSLPKPDHAAPDAQCPCGIYAYHGIGPPVTEYGDHPWAAIQAWGRMQVHHNGFRAEFAQVVLLGIDAKPRNRAVFEMAEEYGCRIVKPNELKEAAREFGEPMPESLRPETQKFSPLPSGYVTINFSAVPSMNGRWEIIEGGKTIKVEE